MFVLVIVDFLVLSSGNRPSNRDMLMIRVWFTTCSMFFLTKNKLEQTKCSMFLLVMNFSTLATGNEPSNRDMQADDPSLFHNIFHELSYP